MKSPSIFHPVRNPPCLGTAAAARGGLFLTGQAPETTWRSYRQVTWTLGVQVEGFTLIEVLIVLAIIGVIATFGIIAGLDTFARYNFHSEQENAVALLQKARSQAINNIGEAPGYGVRFDNAAKKLTLFKVGDPSYDYSIPMNLASTYSLATQITFTQLAGQASCIPVATPCMVAINDGVRNTSITINYEGGIDW